MFMITKREWEAHNAATVPFTPASIPIGRHEIERVPNPGRHSGNWLVLKGTLIGASEGSWRQWKNGQIENGETLDWDEFEIVIEE